MNDLLGYLTENCCGQGVSTAPVCDPAASCGSSILKGDTDARHPMMEEADIKSMVRARYAGIATGDNASCCAPATSCCGPTTSHDDKAREMGYSQAELTAVPEGANLGLGCGNQQAIAAMQPGEIVIDLGSGAGFDCFLAAQHVGSTGHVIGVDMTNEMLAKARENAAKAGATNVEFLGELEHLPVADNTADVAISNWSSIWYPTRHRCSAKPSGC
jgi:hypothetical protein